jgi:hypothetical protein
VCDVEGRDFGIADFGLRNESLQSAIRNPKSTIKNRPQPLPNYTKRNATPPSAGPTTDRNGTASPLFVASRLNVKVALSPRGKIT